mgnify:CR=1 FL=1|jgi:hypothetical protein
MQKGQTNNPNGRPKGKPNQITAFARQCVSDLLAGEMEKIKSELDGLTGEKYINAIIALIAYVIPKPVSAVETPVVERDVRYTVKLLPD